MKRFLKRLPNRLWVLLCLIVLFAFFANDFGLVDIQKTAIVLAAGIDRTPEGFTLTAQIAVPKGTDRTTGGTSGVEIGGKGENISDCLSDLYAKTGWVPKLVFCDLLVLGEGAVREDVFDGLDYFLRNEYIPDSCLLAACEGSAAELLSSESAIDDTSALALGKLFSDAATKSGQVMTTTLREFAIGYFSESRSGYMPYVRMQQQKEGAQKEAQASGGAQNKQSGQSGQDGAQKIYSARETALFSEGRLAALLSPEETLAFSLLKGNVYAGTFTTDGHSYVILKNKGSVDVGTRDVPDIRLYAGCKVQLCGERETASPERLARGELSEQEEAHVSEVLTQYAKRLWDTCAAADCDLLFFRRSLRRASPALYGTWKDVPLSSVPADIVVRAESLR